MFCTNCGQKIEDGMKFCPNCGQPVAPETADAANASDLSTEAAATANASALGADDAAVETVESTTAASAATEDTSAAADAAASAENAPADTPLGNTTEQYKRRLEEGRAASGTEGNSSVGAQRAEATATDIQSNGSTAQSHSGSSDQTQPNSGTARQQTPPPVNHGPAVNGIPSEPDGNGTIRTVAILAIVLLVVLITQKQLNPFAGLSGNLADGLRRDLDRVTDLAQGKNSTGGYDTSTFGGGNAQAAGTNAADAKAYGAAGDSIGAQNGTADHSTAGGPTGGAGQTTADADGNFNRYYQSQSQPGGGYTGPLKTDRSLVLYILLGFLTCGIYQLYVFYTIMRDVNVACDGDGRHTPGLLEFILFGILTCGIYDLYWFYSVGNRLADNAPRYGLRFQENGTTLLLWMLIGSLLCFIGSYVGVYFLLNNVNAICNAYNQQRS